MQAAAAIGFRAHSGWAAAVALTIANGSPTVILRRRIEMGLAQPYHGAALEPADARRIVDSSMREATSMAEAGLQAIIGSLRGLGHAVVRCGLLLASGRTLPQLDSILASHALIHTAEGEHFRDALRAASRASGLETLEVKERDLRERVCSFFGISEARIDQQLAEMGKAIGPPWRQDEKCASLVAWLALAETPRG